MSFLKTKKFWIPFSVIGIGVVAIGTGVGIHQRNQNAINIYEGNSRGEIRTKLRNALNTINANDIRVNLNPSPVTRKSLTQTIGDSGLYAFNVSSNQLGLSSNVSVPSGIQIDFELDEEKNTLQTLNNGVLNVKLIATTPFSDEKQTRDVELNTFKKADTSLSALLTNTNNESILEIKNEANDKKFYSIEQLNTNVTPTNEVNSISNLTALVRKSLNSSSNSNNYSIEGEVKLEKMMKQDDKVYFYLTSASANPLKLVNKTEQASSEILFTSIKLTNLIPSEVIVVPNGYSLVKSPQFGRNLTENKDLRWNIAEGIELKINPYYVQQNATATFTNVAIRVNFGRGDSIKSYDTNRPNELAELNQAGFSFKIFSKKLMSKSSFSLKLSELDMIKNKLGMLFKKESINTPSEKTMATGQGFSEKEFKTSELKANVQIETKAMEASRRSRDGSSMIKTSMDNYVLFADYSFKNIETNKVLLTPSITVVHLDRNIIPPMEMKSTK